MSVVQPPKLNGNVMGFYIQEVLHILEDHVHRPSKTYPSLVGGVQISAQAGAWDTFSEITEIFSAAAAPTEIFDIHWAVISDISANGEYELKLWEGTAGSETEIAHICFNRTAVMSQEGAHPVQTPRIAPGTRISGSLSSSNAVANTAKIKIVLHEY